MRNCWSHESRLQKEETNQEDNEADIALMVIEEPEVTRSPLKREVCLVPQDGCSQEKYFW
jgi:hypothetical protein